MMTTTNNEHLTPTKILYTMIRVGNLERSIEFYQKALGMKELRRENFTKGRFTLVFIGYQDKHATTSIELTYNWDQVQYQHGTSFGHITLGVTDIHASCKYLEKIGIKLIRPPGPMTYAIDDTDHKEEIAFIEDPDGYSIELIQLS